jgi:predicted flap endonuclease-1-like 5' DNA nuclease
MTAGTDAITTIHFALMALLAVAVLIAIAWGVKLKRRRVQAQQEFEAHADEAGVEIIRAEDAPVIAPDPPAPPPVVAPRVAQQPSDHAPRADAPQRPRADAPIATAVVPERAPGVIDAAGDVPAAVQGPDPADGALTQIKGLGPKVAMRLGELGIHRVGQLAALDGDGVRAIDVQMGPFTGRIVRDRWVEQARLLATGDRAGFERAFGKL